MVGVRNGDDAKTVVATYHVGGIFIGSWTDLSMLGPNLVKDLSVSTALPLAVSVDEEGGRVARLSKLIGPAPSARELASKHTPDEVYGMALDRGHRMRGLGITVDFAPDVDVTDAPDDTVIGDRSFSSDPAKVTEYAAAYARGLRDASVLPVIKHFPGHGHGSGDSHTGGVVTPPLSALQTDDLVPYRTLVTAAPGRRDGRPPAGPRAHRRRAGQSQPGRGAVAAHRHRLPRPRLRRPGVQRRPVQHGRDQGPLQRARRGAARRCRPASMSRCG